MIYFQLFLSFFQIGLLSFGGGYAAMPLIQGQVVQGHGWLSMSEFTDLITISQMTPGPLQSIRLPSSELKSPASQERSWQRLDVFCRRVFSSHCLRSYI